MAFQFPEDDVEAHRQGRIISKQHRSLLELISRARSSMESGEYQEALDTLLLALPIARDTGNRRQEYHILSAMGDVYLKLRKYKAAIKCQRLAIKVIKEDMKAWISEAQTAQEKRQRTQAAETQPAGIISTPRRYSRQSSRRSRSKSKLPKCPECGSAIETDDTFCMSCGKEVVPSK